MPEPCGPATSGGETSRARESTTARWGGPGRLTCPRPPPAHTPRRSRPLPPPPRAAQAAQRGLGQRAPPAGAAPPARPPGPRPPRGRHLPARRLCEPRGVGRRRDGEGRGGAGRAAERRGGDPPHTDCRPARPGGRGWGGRPASPRGAPAPGRSGASPLAGAHAASRPWSRGTCGVRAGRERSGRRSAGGARLSGEEGRGWGGAGLGRAAAEPGARAPASRARWFPAPAGGRRPGQKVRGGADPRSEPALGGAGTWDGGCRGWGEGRPEGRAGRAGRKGRTNGVAAGRGACARGWAKPRSGSGIRPARPAARAWDAFPRRPRHRRSVSSRPRDGGKVGHDALTSHPRAPGAGERPRRGLGRLLSGGRGRPARGRRCEGACPASSFSARIQPAAPG